MPIYAKLERHSCGPKIKKARRWMSPAGWEGRRHGREAATQGDAIYFLNLRQITAHHTKKMRAYIFFRKIRTITRRSVFFFWHRPTASIFFIIIAQRCRSADHAIVSGVHFYTFMTLCLPPIIFEYIFLVFFKSFFNLFFRIHPGSSVHNSHIKSCARMSSIFISKQFRLMLTAFSLSDL